jgi:hypothetical protein
VVAEPFPHVAKSGILPAELFARLKQDFPDQSYFDDQQSETGAVGSRTGAGTGFDIYRGDSAYDQLIAKSAAWAELDRFINSPEFVSQFLDIFGPDLAALGLKATISHNCYDPQLVEPRDVLTAQLSWRERLRLMLARLRIGKPGPARLFTRLDIERSTKGYLKPPHCDRANRLCSLIIYFTDMAAEGIEGGELTIHRSLTHSDPSSHPRHPKPSEVETVAEIQPAANLGVFFPCSNNSYHGVKPVLTPGKARDFLYINISVDAASCW